MSLSPGTEIGAWHVEAKLGRGGMGSVYKCRHAEDDRVSAVKLLDPEFATHPEGEIRFLREAEILSNLDHPNVVSIRNAVLDAQPPFIEMEFVRGESLVSVLGQRRPPLHKALAWTRALASALAYLHERGVFHRDIKPENILVEGAEGLTLVDFGLAIEKDGRKISMQGKAQFGTVSYCPPEWMNKEDIDPGAWDRYSFGVVVYEMLTGKMAFPATPGRAERLQILQVVSRKAAMPCLDPGEGIPPALRELVKQLTARMPEDRPASMNDVLRVLNRLDQKTPVMIANVPRDAGPVVREPQANPPAVPSRSVRSFAARWVPFALGFGGMAVLTMGMAFVALLVLFLAV